MKKYWLAFGLFIFTSQLNAKDVTPEILTIYTNSAVASPYGTGPFIKGAFEKTCHCEVKYVAVDTLPLVLNRLQLEGNKTKADVVLGLEDPVLEMASSYVDHITPYASQCLGFVYDSKEIPNPPSTLDALIHSSYPIILQDPRTSITGLEFLIWMKKAYGDQTFQKWQALNSHVLTYTKGWGDSYSLFTKRAAPIALSYTTSPLVHELTEGKTNIKVIHFAEGHLCSQIYAGKVKITAHSSLADQFIAFLFTKEAQQIMADHGWVYPKGDLPESWLNAATFLAHPSSIPYTPQEVFASQKGWIQEWLEGLTQ